MTGLWQQDEDVKSACWTRYCSPSLGPGRKKALHEELKRILKECYAIGYTAGYFRNDLANSDPAELCLRYTFNPPTDGFMRLLQEDRLDLAVENAVWKFRQDFPREVVSKARDRLREFGFDVVTQRSYRA